jgi:FkbM family methyltransferase
MSWAAGPILAAMRTYSRLTPTERGGYRLARLARRFVDRDRWQGKFTTPEGLIFSLDLAAYPDCCMALGLYELDTVRLLKRVLRPGMWFADCGANIGYFTLLAAQLVGETGRVDAYEPDPLNFARLTEHLADNRLTGRVRTHALAVSDRAARLELFHPEGNGANHGMASIYAELAGGGKRFEVDAVRLDENLGGVPDVIKIDVEGAEMSALKGMERLLRGERPPSLIMERNVDSARAAGHRPGDLLRYLQSVQPRYQAHWIGWRLKRLASAEEMDNLPRQGNVWIAAV